jgi:glutathione-regulated potassium-efflux system ancillary protein KefG
MMRILILFAHPALERSRVNRRLVETVADLPGVTFHDLYEAYPTFDIDVALEQKLLASHDIVVLQHPFFWYSTPALVKQWEDLVLEHGWAYGSGGTALQGKVFLSVLTTGGSAAAYRADGLNRFEVREFLRPIEQTVRLCKMEFLPPFVAFGTHRMERPDIDRVADDYRRVIEGLRDERIDMDAAQRYPLLNAGLEEILKEAVP